jgi:hypothetical protein
MGTLFRIMGLGIFAAVKMWIVVSWIVTPCCLVGEYQHFGGTFRLISVLKVEAIRCSETEGLCTAEVAHARKPCVVELGLLTFVVTLSPPKR